MRTKGAAALGPRRARSEAAIKAAGKLRIEGREYVMQEGDVAHFLIGK